jgi:hypothetical protein
MARIMRRNALQDMVALKKESISVFGTTELYK